MKAADDIMIRVIDLTMGWDDVVLQENATFDVDRGDIFAILGGSGCGKSTLLRYLIGLEEPHDRQRARSTGIGAPNLEVGRPPFGVMFQSGALFGSMTVGENVGPPARGVDRPAARGDRRHRARQAPARRPDGA